MSYSLGIHQFADGEPVQPDMDVVQEVLAPYDAAPEKPRTDEFWIRAADGGEAELFVSDDVIAVERPALGEIRGIIAELADRLGAVILTPRGTLLCREDSRAHLPTGLEDAAVFVAGITREALDAATTLAAKTP
ncbi:hypothetical protein [Streptomyces sp. NPDC058572]|uniref:hypothetical protein n=1 Tax=Streptomyces sp. NPDC058572 TaxID=3346546 RepID=UPI003666FDF1